MIIIICTALYLCKEYTYEGILLTFWVSCVLKLSIDPLPDVVHRWVVPTTIQFQAEDAIMPGHLYVFKK